MGDVNRAEDVELRQWAPLARAGRRRRRTASAERTLRPRTRRRTGAGRVAVLLHECRGGHIVHREDVARWERAVLRFAPSPDGKALVM